MAGTDAGTRAATGIEGLDEVLGGGLIPQRLYLVEGTPGSGKTTLALQFLRHGVAAGERCLYVTLSESTEELLAGAVSHGWSLDDVEVAEFVAGDDELQADEQLTMYRPVEVELGHTTRRILDAVAERRPQRLVIDSLSELRLLAQDPLRFRRQILALKQFLGRRRCTTLLLDDQTSEPADLQLHSIAHGVLSLERRTPAYGPVLRQVQVTKFRGSDFRTGLQDFCLQRGGLRVFPRLASGTEAHDFVRESVPSGVARLDELLGGGIDRGTATLLLGPPGTGKSTIAVQYAVGAAGRGDHAAVFTFEETRSLLLDRARSLGQHIDEGRGPGCIAVHQVDPAEVSPGEFANLVREAVEDDAARVVVIDSLNGYLNAMPEERALNVQLHELLTYLNNRGVATFVVAAQSGITGPGLKSTVDASYLADAVVLLRLFEHEGCVKKAISVIKKRSGRHEESIRQLWFDAAGVHLGPPLLGLTGVLGGMPVPTADAPPLRQAPGDAPIR
jgi:circadian clock protein KaiC